jgi:hypothetical protein
VFYPAAVSLAFFEVAAQVVPVLFFVLLFDLGMARATMVNVVEYVAAAVVILLLAAGEIVSLDVVASKHPTQFAGVVVTVAIAFTLGTIASALIETSIREAEIEGRLSRHPRLFSGALQAVIVSGAILSFSAATH